MILNSQVILLISQLVMSMKLDLMLTDTRDEFGPKFFGPGLKWAMEIMAWPGHGPKPMLAFGPGRAWAKFKTDGPGWAGPKFENILKKLTFSLVFQFKIAKYDVFHNF